MANNPDLSELFHKLNMKLLMITRKIDKNDSRAGFIYNWVSKLAQNLDKLIVICQEAGEISGLPKNIDINSLGKEKGNSKLRQFVKLQSLIASRLSSVDGVFAHMMPIYSIAVGPLCKIWRKKLIQWYMHKSVDWRLRLANIFVSEYATASALSFRLKTKKKVNILGHGIDIQLFAPKNKKANRLFNIITIGRISPSKDYESMIKAVYDLKDRGVSNIKLDIIGGAGLKKQEIYLENLKTMVKNMNLEKQVKFLGPVPNNQTPAYLQKADLFINLSHTGSLDKAVLEAMASQTLVLTTNEAFKEILPDVLFTAKDNPGKLVQSIENIIRMDSTDKDKLRKKLRQEVINNHNLDNLVKKIINLFQ